MKGKSLTYVLLGALLVALGVPVLATMNLPHTFSPGTPIRSTEVNANFQALVDGINTLEASKQNAVSGSPCGAGQFVRGISADGALECGVDQIGSGGNAGISSLNGLTGSLAIEAGANVTVDTLTDGKIIVSAVGGDGLSLPFSGQADSGNAAFAVTNNSATALSGMTANGNGVFGLSSASGNGVSGYSETGYGVIGMSNTGLSGVYGESKISGGAGVYGANSVGPGSSGVWGESTGGSGVRGTSTSGTGVLGTSQQGYGVRGTVSTSGTGVYGENSSNSAGAGVQGRADYVNSVGVAGTSAAGTGVRGTSQSGYGVRGTTQTGDAGVFGTSSKLGGAGVLGTDGTRDSIAVRGNASNTGSVGVWGQATNATGVYGQSTSGTGVWGKSTAGPAMRAEGHAVQSLGSGGWAKAMVYVDHTRPAGQQIVRCFNSQATGAAATTPPCGFSLDSVLGLWRVNFGFDTSRTFVAASLIDDSASCFTYPCAFAVIYGLLYGPSDVTVRIVQVGAGRDGRPTNRSFTLVLY